MYPADDILIRVRLATEHARALKASIETQLARARALQERARCPGFVRDAALAAEVSEVARTSCVLLEDAREHRRRAELLVEQSRRRRQGVAGERD
jgi:hypothetical protein